MILLTVGTQLPFDRLVKAVDAIAPQLPYKVFAQIGQGEYIPRNFEYCRMAPPEELAEKFRSASRVISHAGTGSLLMARRYQKPIILFPRRASLGEHRNDHQLATCQQLEGTLGLAVAYDESQLHTMLGEEAKVSVGESNPAAVSIGSELGREIADYIRQVRPTGK